MKSRSLRHLPRTLVVCFAPVLACATASAEILDFNEANTTNVWTIPAGTNLLSMPGNIVSPATPATHESSSGSWSTLTDGILGAPGNNTAVVTPNNGDSVTYQLDLTGNPDGYDITSFDSYATWGDSGRDNQNYSLQVSTDGVAYNTVAVVSNVDSSANKATHTSVTDTSGVLATGVKFVRVLFGSPTGQENGYVGMSELVLRAVPTNVITQLEAATSNGWTLPAGTNLLNGATASVAPATLSREGSSTDLSILTNGILGAGSDFTTSVTPDNNSSFIFPLNTSVNFNGYNISSLDTYCAWANSGRDNQNMAVSYSVVGAESVFIPLGNLVVRTGEPNSSTHVRLTPQSGFLATGVAAIKITTGHQENGYVGLREFIALGTAVSISDPLTWTGGSGSSGAANWTTAPDSNWKKTVDGSPANFSSLAALTFDSVPTNRNISVPTALTASSMSFTNGVSSPYTFGGALVTVSNDIQSSGNGSATFNNAIKTGTGVTQSGSGSLVFNGALESVGMTLAGPGGINLNAANPALTGNVSVSDGVLTVSNNDAMTNAGLSMTGGIARFISATPHVGSIASDPFTPGAIILGNTTGPVNTNLSVGDSASVSTFGGTLSQASGTVGSFTKTGNSFLTLSGENTYTGVTTVNGGTLELAQYNSLYAGIIESWTASNLVVASGGTLSFKVGGVDQFTEPQIDNDVSLGGFAPGSFFGINNSSFDVTLTRSLTQPGLGLVKTGSSILNLTGNNTSNGLVKLFGGTINAASSGGTAINGNVLMGNGSDHVFLNMGSDNQLAPTGVISFSNGNFYQSKINLRGTNQTIAGLDSPLAPANRVSLIQNDEIGQPGYAGSPIAASLTINATGNHSYYGLIRDQDGGAVSVIKNGVGTQEFRNITPIQGFGYTGPTTINEGTLRINFTNANNSFLSNVTIEDPGILNFHSEGGGYDFNPIISGAGEVLVTGNNPIALTNGLNSWTGGTIVDGGFLALKTINGNDIGAGNGDNQTCIAGAMTPLNVIQLINGGTLSLDAAAPLGQSTMLPAFAPTIIVNPGSKIFGGTNTVAFVPNITLNGASIEITGGANTGAFDTNLAPVGTVTIGGTAPSTIFTNANFLPAGPTPSAFANMSLGSVGAPGTTFAVANVTNDAADDLIVSSILRNVSSLASPLTKTGPGTMLLSGANTYTGDTTVTGGELTVSGDSIVDTNKLVLDGGKLGLAADETVGTLFYAGVQQIAGTYGSTSSTATFKDDTRFAGTAVLTVTTDPVVSDPYVAWSSAITNPDDRDRTDDADGDGFTNLQEYLFGTSPIANTGTLSTFEKSGTNLIVRWYERAGVNYVLQESTTLESPWPTSLVEPAIAGDQGTPYSLDYVRKEAIFPIDINKKFVRVQATE
jgi:autotransporter-associated beta strand protein